MRLSCCVRAVLITGFFCLWSCNMMAQVLIEDQASGQLGEPLTDSYQTPTNVIVQSFTPALNGIGFLQLLTVVSPSVSGGGVTVQLQLRESGSLGPVIATTAPLFMQNQGNEFTTFFFDDNVPITSGREYFFEPVVLDGGILDVLTKKSPSAYDRGELYLNGFPSGGLSDLWFREGIVVPEPGTVWLVLTGLFLLLGCSRRRNRS